MASLRAHALAPPPAAWDDEARALVWRQRLRLADDPAAAPLFCAATRWDRPGEAAGAAALLSAWRGADLGAALALLGPRWAGLPGDGARRTAAVAWLEALTGAAIGRRLSTPAPAAAVLVEQLDIELARQLRGIHYTPISIVHTGFKRSQVKHRFNGSGFLVPRQSGFTPNGCLWMSSLFDDHAPEDRVLMSTYLGGARNPAAAGWDTQRSQDAVMHMLSTLMGIKSDPDMLHVVRHTSGLPLYHGAYSRRLAAIGERLSLFPGLHLEANYKGGVSVRDRILCAEKIACRILRQLDSRLPANDFGFVHIPVPLTASLR